MTIKETSEKLVELAEIYECNSKSKSYFNEAGSAFDMKTAFVAGKVAVWLMGLNRIKEIAGAVKAGEIPQSVAMELIDSIFSSEEMKEEEDKWTQTT